MTMWSSVILLGLAHVGSGFVLRSFSVPASPDYGTTVFLEAEYQLGPGETIQRLRWSKDDSALLTYTEDPSPSSTWGSFSGINIDKRTSLPSRLVLRDVGDGASGQYTLAILVAGPDGSVSSFVNSNSMAVGGVVNGLGNRFGGSAGPASATSFQSSSASAGGTVGDGLGNRGGFQSSTVSSGPDGIQTSFQSGTTGTFFNGMFGPGFPFNTGAGGLDTRGGFASGDINSALAQATENIRRAQAQLNLIQQALAGLGGGY